MKSCLVGMLVFASCVWCAAGTVAAAKGEVKAGQASGAEGTSEVLTLDFENPEILSKVKSTSTVKYELVSEHATSGQTALKVMILKGKRPANGKGSSNTGFRIPMPDGFPSDWRDYREVTFDLYMPPGPGEVIWPVLPGTWQTGQYVGQGLRKPTIALDTIRADLLKNVRSISVRTRYRDYDRTFYIDNVRLRKKGVGDLEAVKINFLSPRFRGQVYATHPVTNLEAEVYLDMASDDLQKMDIVVQLVDHKDVLAEETLPKGATHHKVQFPFPEKGDDFRLAVKLLTDGHEVRTVDRSVRRMPPGKDEVIVREDKTLLVNGTPFFPVGVFCHAPPREFKHIKDLGFNCVGPYANPVGNPAYLTAAKTHNLRMLCPVGHNIEPAKLKTLGESGNILGYYLLDEPKPNTWPREKVTALVQHFAKADPYHPAVTLHHAEFPYYAGIADIMMVDAYDIPGPFRNIKQRMSGAVRHMAPFGPVWAVPQIFTRFAYKGFPNTLEGMRSPQYDELRSETWLNIAMGAKGIFYYNYWTSGPDTIQRISYPDVWESLGHVVKELNGLTPMLLAGDPVDVQRNADAKELYTRAWAYEGNLYIVAVNASYKDDLEGRITIEGEGQNYRGATLYAIGEGKREVKLDGNTLTDHFTPQETHIYTANPSWPELVDVIEVRREMKAREAARQKQQANNVARTDHGAVLSASWNLSASKVFPKKGELSPVGGRVNSLAWRHMIDGNRGTYWVPSRSKYKWADDDVNKGERWIEVTFKVPVPLERVNIVAPENFSYTLTAFTANHWQTLEPEKESTTNAYHLTTVTKVSEFECEGLTAGKLRITFSQPGQSSIFEIEAYKVAE